MPWIINVEDCASGRSSGSSLTGREELQQQALEEGEEELFEPLASPLTTPMPFLIFLARQLLAQKPKQKIQRMDLVRLEK